MLLWVRESVWRLPFSIACKALIRILHCLQVSRNPWVAVGFIVCCGCSTVGGEGGRGGAWCAAANGGRKGWKRASVPTWTPHMLRETAVRGRRKSGKTDNRAFARSAGLGRSVRAGPFDSGKRKTAFVDFGRGAFLYRCFTRRARLRSDGAEMEGERARAGSLLTADNSP